MYLLPRETCAIVDSCSISDIECIKGRSLSIKAGIVWWCYVKYNCPEQWINPKVCLGPKLKYSLSFIFVAFDSHKKVFFSRQTPPKRRGGEGWGVSEPTKNRKNYTFYVLRYCLNRHWYKAKEIWASSMHKICSIAS